MKEYLSELTYDKLIFETGLYKEIIIKANDYEYVEYEDYMNNDYEQPIDMCGYKIGKDLIEFKQLLQQSGKTINFCPYCKREMSLQYIKNIISKELNISKFSEVPIDYLIDGDAELHPEYDYDKLLDSFNSAFDTFQKTLVCSHNENHIQTYFFKLKKNESELSIQKIGQYPPISDFLLKDKYMFEKLLGRYDILSDYRMGSYMYSHGVGAGSYAYLRRVLEKLIIKKYEIHFKTSPDYNIEAFYKMRMNEKLELLNPYLPNFLLTNKKLYGILSAGIHTYSDKKCMTAFPNLKNAIDIILDEENKSIEEQAFKKKVKTDLDAFSIN